MLLEDLRAVDDELVNRSDVDVADPGALGTGLDGLANLWRHLLQPEFACARVIPERPFVMLDLVIGRDEDARRLTVAPGDEPRMIDRSFEPRGWRLDGLLRPTPFPLGDRDDLNRQTLL